MLSPADFASFHLAVHGKEAFKWQSRLLEQVDRERKWPKTLDLPTGSGKTTCVDIALFALALDAQRKNDARWCPRRIAMVVDRRVVVDQVARRGHELVRALRDSKDPTVAVVSELLRGLSGSATKTKRDDEQDVVGVFTLRGGMPKDDGWARTPTQPLILASTVDQIGSRMLLQGYGVSRGMKPVHAGLLANDLLLLLDEVHLSQPFQQLLDALGRLRRRFKTIGANRFNFAALSATPGETDEEPFRLLEDEKHPDSPLGPRLHASKPAKFREVASRTELEQQCVAEAERLVRKHHTVAVVANRVASAMTIAKALEESAGDACDVFPLTGRMRPLDRDDVMERLRPRIETGHGEADGKPVIVVGTQCIEAGADFDFNAMVTECASLDALRQRFGRVDRLGGYRRSESVILFDKNNKKPDPVYGDALADTAKWLKAIKQLDFGVLALELPDDMKAVVAPKEDAPVLLPAYLDLWMQTSPSPAAVPDVSLWLHGPRSGPADVQVIWRDGFEESDLREAVHNPEAKEQLIALVGSIRPSSLEAISLPLYAARRWLQGFAPGDIADAEGTEPDDDERRTSRPVLRWDGDDSRVISAPHIAPGDTIIIPSSRGGVRSGCFDETANEPVRDLAEKASFFARGIPALRLEGALAKRLGLAYLEDIDELRPLVQTALDGSGLEAWEKMWLAALAKATTILEETGPGRRPVRILRGKRVAASELVRLRTEFSAEAGVEITTDEEDSFFTGRKVSLQEHSGDVEARARAYAESVGLSENLVNDLALAGWLHDIGKADPRFQVMLCGGSEIEFLKNDKLLAKSAMEPEDRAGRERARAKSRYPKGTRHEALSLAMIEHHDKVLELARDPDLVLHLVASHHGYCRPFAPAVVDEEPVDVKLDGHKSSKFGTLSFGPRTSRHDLHLVGSGLADRFWLLVEKYGWLELCWLEAILRLADHRASEEEQERDEEEDA